MTIEIPVPTLRVMGHADEELRQSIKPGVGDSGSIHSWELVTAVDGPGTRLTIFLAGCALRCLYCHNPDTWRMRDGKIQSVDEVMDLVRRYAPVLRATGGGLTISGGEPLLQAAFVQRIMHGAKVLGLHTALDTSGFLGARVTNDMLRDTNLVLLDIKSGLPETYRAVTGRSLEPTLDFARRLSALGIPMWIRYVLVPGLTDAEDNVEAVAEFVSSLASVERVEVLPFHQMGREKWKALEEPYQLDETEPPSEELVARVRGQFSARGITTF